METPLYTVKLNLILPPAPPSPALYPGEGGAFAFPLSWTFGSGKEGEG